MTKENNSIYRKNVKVLSERYPKILEKINFFEETKIEHEIIDARDGNRSLIIKNDGKRISINSKYRPVKEAETWAGSFQLKYDTLVIVFGLGLGYRLKELAKRLSNDNILIIFEPNKELFKSIIQHIDISDVLGHDNIYLYVGERKNQYSNILYNYVSWKNIDSIILQAIPNYDKVFNNDFSELVKALENIKLRKLSDKNTMWHFRNIWQRNQLLNIPYMLKSTCVKELFDAFKDKPAIIVSAGPSLNKNVKLLKKAKNKAVIICVGTALRALLKENIKPDIVIVIDGGEANYEHFKGIDYSKITLAYNSVANYKIIKNHTGNKVMFASFNHYIMDFFHKYGRDIGFIKSGGSVSNSAMDLAVKIGANPIIFVGQDLAYTDNKSHAEGTLYGEKVVEDDEPDIIYVEDIHGRKIKTSLSLYKFLKWFEAEIGKDTSNRLYIDATEGGAKIKGTVVMTLEEAIEHYCTDIIDVNKKLDKVFKRGQKFAKHEIIKVKKDIELVQEKLLIIKSLCEQGEELATRLQHNVLNIGKEEDHGINNKIINKLNLINSAILSEGEVFGLIELITEPILVQMTNLIEDNSINRQDSKLLSVGIAFYRSLKEAIDYVEPFVIMSMEDLQQLIHIKG